MTAKYTKSMHLYFYTAKVYRIRLTYHHTFIFICMSKTVTQDLKPHFYALLFIHTVKSSLFRAYISIFSIILNLTIVSANMSYQQIKQGDKVTSLTQSRLEMIFNRTSGHSSFSCVRNSGNKCSIVLKYKTYSLCKHLWMPQRKVTHFPICFIQIETGSTFE